MDRQRVVSVSPKVTPKRMNADGNIAIFNRFVEKELARGMMPESNDKLDDNEPICTPAVATIDKDLARLGVGKQVSDVSESHTDAWAAVGKMRYELLASVVPTLDPRTVTKRGLSRTRLDCAVVSAAGAS